MSLMRVRVYFERRDLWIGVYIDRNHVYVCLLPTLVIRFDRRRHRHKWRQNVAWSHLMRCDSCGEARDKTAEDVVDETIAYLKRGTAK